MDTCCLYAMLTLGTWNSWANITHTLAVGSPNMGGGCLHGMGVYSGTAVWSTVQCTCLVFVNCCNVPSKHPSPCKHPPSIFDDLMTCVCGTHHPPPRPRPHPRFFFCSWISSAHGCLLGALRYKDLHAHVRSYSQTHTDCAVEDLHTSTCIVMCLCQCVSWHSSKEGC